MDKSLTASTVSFSPSRAGFIAGLISLILVVVALFGLVGFVSFDPYVKDVLALKGNPDRGQAIFGSDSDVVVSRKACQI